MASSSKASHSMDPSTSKSSKKNRKKKKTKDIQEHLNSVKLVIVVKSHLYGDYCYLGYHQGSNRIFRPMLKERVEMDIGRSYMFFYKLSEQSNLPLPHGHNDLIVHTYMLVEDVNLLTWISTIECLMTWALPTFFDGIQRHSSTVIDIFGQKKRTFKFYIDEGSDMASAGVLLTHKVNIYKTTTGKKRIELCLLKKNPGTDDSSRYELYDLPYTALDTPPEVDLMNPAIQKLAMVSMCRPYAGIENFTPRRCYLLVAGILLRR